MAASFEQGDWYDAPLYYDIVFEQHTRPETAFVEAMYARWVSRGRRRILEPACGSGRLIEALAGRGFEVDGFDASEPMLRFARERLARAAGVKRKSPAPRAGLRQARMEAFSCRRRYDLAHCFVSTFKYLPSEADAAAHLRCVAAALRRGGVYLLGFHLTDYQVERAIDRERWTGARGDVSVVCNIQSWPPKRRARSELVRSRLRVTRRGREVRRFETQWSFRTYSPAQFRALLRRVPELELVAVHDFDYDPEVTHELGSDRMDVVAVLRRR